MRRVCLTVDLDRDVNIPSDGSVKACSADRGQGTEARFSSSRKGTEIISDLLDEIGIRATFFAEARALKETGAADVLTGHEIALHGLDHEDMTGASCGIRMSDEELKDVLIEAKDIIRDLTGKDPVGFRAPYMRFERSKYHILEGIGMRYDSSVYSDVGESMVPYRIGRMIEFPVPQFIDDKGKRMTAYLWPMHEGKRVPEDYVRMARQMKDGVFVLATHTWHMAETVCNGPMDPSEIEKNTNGVRKIIETLADEGFVFDPLDSLIGHF